MKTTLIALTGLLLAGGAAAPAALAQAAVTPKLAANVKPAPGYEAVGEKFVAANPTPIFSDMNEVSAATGQLDKVGEPVQTLAKVPGWDWYLVGKDGVGIGYVPRSLLKPARG